MKFLRRVKECNWRDIRIKIIRKELKIFNLKQKKKRKERNNHLERMEENRLPLKARCIKLKEEETVVNQEKDGNYNR